MASEYVAAKLSLSHLFRVNGMKNVSDRGTATRMDTANVLIFCISRYWAYVNRMLSIDINGNATMKPARTGFRPASQEEKAMTHPEKMTLNVNHMNLRPRVI